MLTHEVNVETKHILEKILLSDTEMLIYFHFSSCSSFFFIWVFFVLVPEVSEKASIFAVQGNIASKMATGFTWVTLLSDQFTTAILSLGEL